MAEPKGPSFQDERGMTAETAPRRPTPEVSVILPGYLSHDTVAGCLEALRRQSFPSFEVVVVDSSPDRRTADVVAAYPEVHLVRSSRRLLPHAARNVGAARARGDLLVFIDPDVYPRPDWLARLVAAHRATGHPVVGALACHGDAWLDHGVHLCKFSKWLPGGRPRPVDVSPTANMLIDGATFRAAGGFAGDEMQGDALFSWQLLRCGSTLWFEPRAVVAHHHLTGFGAFLRERYRRGAELAGLRSDWAGFGRRRQLLYLAVSLLPVRLARVAGLVLSHALGAGQAGRLLATLPVVLAGHHAWLLGESRTYARLLFTPGRRRGSASFPTG